MSEKFKNELLEYMKLYELLDLPELTMCFRFRKQVSDLTYALLGRIEPMS